MRLRVHSAYEGFDDFPYFFVRTFFFTVFFRFVVQPNSSG